MKKRKYTCKTPNQSLANMTPDQQAMWFNNNVRITPLTLSDHLLIGNYDGLRQYLRAKGYLV